MWFSAKTACKVVINTLEIQQGLEMVQSKLLLPVMRLLEFGSEVINFRTSVTTKQLVPT